MGEGPAANLSRVTPGEYVLVPNSQEVAWGFEPIGRYGEVEPGPPALSILTPARRGRNAIISIVFDVFLGAIRLPSLQTPASNLKVIMRFIWPRVC